MAKRIRRKMERATDGEFITQIGRTDKGDFVRVSHLPSGKERFAVGLKGKACSKLVTQFTQEILAELDSEMKRQSTGRNCPLTGNSELRQAIEEATSAIQDQFPPGLSQPALRALATAGYTSLSQLADISDKELLALHGMGPKGVRILREALKSQH